MSSPEVPAEEGAEEPAPEAEPAATAPLEPEPQPEPADPARHALIDALRSKLGDAVVASEIVGGDLWVRVNAAAWRVAIQTAKNDLGMDYFCFLSGIDWLQNPSLGGRDVWDPAADTAAAEADDEALVTGIAGGDSRFQLLARVYSTRTHLGITFKADLGETTPTVASITSVYRGADWHEREAWEMYGFDFEGHPGLRHMYLPGEFEGNPLRKDFPMLAREVKPWPGLVDKEQIPGEAEPAEDAVSESEEGASA